MAQAKTPCGQFKSVMKEVIRKSKVIHDHAYDLGENEELEMKLLVNLVNQAKELMEIIRPPEPDTTMVGVQLDLDPEVLTQGKVVFNDHEEKENTDN